jgi:uncharacterized SAM-binding protein YcdF (DUF218 family)
MGELKPILTALILPPTSLLLWLMLGWHWRRQWAGSLMLLSGILALWLLSCHGSAVWLARHALPQYPSLSAADLRAQGTQAIVVLGGGLEPLAEGQTTPSPNSASLMRLHHAAGLARETGLPLAFAGGVGWANVGTAAPTEAQAAQAALAVWGLRLKWSDDRSRDTEENAQATAALLQGQGIRRIALVTHATHMPRSVWQFEAAGFEVLPAPMGAVLPRSRAVLEWLPSARGLWASQEVLREWLGLQVARLKLAWAGF